MKLLYILLILGVTACSTQPKKEVMIGRVIPEGKKIELPEGHAKLIHDKEIFQMTRQETVNAIQDCHSAGLRAVMYHGRIRANGRYVPIVVQVLCAPKIKLN